ncbi:MAG: hypothetical protein FWE82_05440 [Defluviitaleaceae bacterium]|nr:hypothetical protein [Defluviitaleaceae bacterium]
MKTANIVFIGAGSMSFGKVTFGDLFTSPELAGATLTLVDTNEANLDRMYRIALKMNEASAMGLQIKKTTDRREAFVGAEYVINSLAIDRCNLWRHDFHVPLKHGIKHCLGENGGPGALFFTMRTIPLVIEICRDMEELCPDAWFLNFSNPESRIILAINRYTKIKSIGFCHGVYMGRNAVAGIMGIPFDEISVTAAGLNHFQWLLSIRRISNNEDLYPLLRKKEAALDPKYDPFSRKIFKAFGYWATCSDDHLGEYLQYGYEAGMHGYDFDGDDQNRIKTTKYFDELLEGKHDINEMFKKSSEKAVEVIAALHNGTRKDIPAGIVYNDGAIKNLPDDLAVEIPIIVDGSGMTKTMIGNVPSGAAALMSLQIGAQQMSVEAAAKGDKQLALQALLVDPVVNSTSAAEKILDELWEINKPYIRNVL